MHEKIIILTQTDNVCTIIIYSQNKDVFHFYLFFRTLLICEFSIIFCVSFCFSSKPESLVQAIMYRQSLCILRIRRHVKPFYRFSSMLAHKEAESGTNKLEIAPIKLIPKSFHAQMFGGQIPETYNEDESAIEKLSKFQLPALKSSNGVFDHFKQIASDQFKPYQELLEAALSVSSNLPPKPAHWQLTVGWTKYNADGSFEQVEAPSDKILFFDVEVCTKDGQLPTLAVALSPTNWYSWCSDRYVNLSEFPQFPRLQHLIPLECSGESHLPKIVIGHNIGYDRARVREQYVLKESATKFWDTMSMNTVIMLGVILNENYV